jgi:hypothetical protein
MMLTNVIFSRRRRRLARSEGGFGGRSTGRVSTTCLGDSPMPNVRFIRYFIHKTLGLPTSNETTKWAIYLSSCGATGGDRRQVPVGTSNIHLNLYPKLNLKLYLSKATVDSLLNTKMAVTCYRCWSKKGDPTVRALRTRSTTLTINAYAN